MKGKPTRRRYLTYVGGAVAIVAVGAGGYGAYHFYSSPELTPIATITKRIENGDYIMSYTLPDLPYGYDALEPVISKEIVTIHHDKHHNGYVNGANSVLEKLKTARAADFQDVDIRALERDLAFNVSGHVLHALYWQNMSPDGGGTPGGALADLIDKSFGGYNAFKSQLSLAAKNVEGSGWGLLVYEPIINTLLILQIQNHQNLAIHGSVPLLTIDVWEHAYYLQYKNDRGSYVDQWWNKVNWDDVEARLASCPLP